MKQYISKYHFTDWFLSSDTYKNNFSYEGLHSLFDYLEQFEEKNERTILYALRTNTKMSSDFGCKTPMHKRLKNTMEKRSGRVNNWGALQHHPKGE